MRSFWARFSLVPSTHIQIYFDIPLLENDWPHLLVRPLRSKHGTVPPTSAPPAEHVESKKKAGSGGSGRRSRWSWSVGLHLGWSRPTTPRSSPPSVAILRRSITRSPGRFPTTGTKNETAKVLSVTGRLQPSRLPRSSPLPPRSRRRRHMRLRRRPDTSVLSIRNGRNLGHCAREGGGSLNWPNRHLQGPLPRVKLPATESAR